MNEKTEDENNDKTLYSPCFKYINLHEANPKLWAAMMTEDEMAGWHHWLDGRESQWTPGVGDGQGGLVCCDSWGRKELDMTERLIWSDLIWWCYMDFPCGSAGKKSTCNVGDLGLIPGLGRSPREGKSYPFQYSFLENSMDSIVHGVAKSQTWLSDFHFTWCYMGFPGGSVVKNPPANAGDRDTSLIPGSGRSPGEGNSNTLVSRQSHGEKSLVGYSPWGHKRVWHDLMTRQQQMLLHIYIHSL